LAITLYIPQHTIGFAQRQPHLDMWPPLVAVRIPLAVSLLYIADFVGKVGKKAFLSAANFPSPGDPAEREDTAVQHRMRCALVRTTPGGSLRYGAIGGALRSPPSPHMVYYMCAFD
jgi:hypothetical protein